MMPLLGTPPAQKRIVAMPNAGSHVMASPIQSKDVPGVEKETEKFLQEVMKMKEAGF
jgi:hypothetical protein